MYKQLTRDKVFYTITLWITLTISLILEIKANTTPAPGGTLSPEPPTAAPTTAAPTTPAPTTPSPTPPPVVADNPCTRNPCNIVAYTTHTCAVVGTTFECTCDPGYIRAANRRSCIDINECSNSDTNVCDGQEGVASCNNLQGDYECVCETGYELDSTRKICSDIDECTTDAHNCEPEEHRVTCTNTPGSHTCTCRTSEGFTGDGATCIGNRLPSVSGPTRLGSLDFSPYIFPEFAVPINTDGGGSIYVSSFYFTKTGFIIGTIVPSDASAQGNRVAFANPAFLEDFSNNQIKAQFASWASASMEPSSQSSTSGVYYKVYSSENSADASALATAEQEIKDSLLPINYTVVENFVAKFMLVLTLTDMKYGSTSLDSETVNVQTVLVTDYINTFVKAVFQDRAMNWNLASDTIPSQYPAKIGFAVADASDAAQSTGLVPSTLEEIQDVDTYYQYISPDSVTSFTDLRDQWVSDKYQYTNVRQTAISINTGPAGLVAQGIFTFALTSNTVTDNPAIQCSTWMASDDAITSFIIDRNHARTCPCTRRQLTVASTYTQFGDSAIPSGITCYFRKFTALLTEQRAVRCCYRDSDSSIVDDPIGANGFNTYRRFDNDSQVNYQQCCVQSTSGFSKYNMCQLFLLRRPLGTCSLFVPPTASQTEGDPHIQTLDGVSYTFNGLGEFTLIDSTSFILQGRTSQVLRDGQPQPATIFSSVVAKHLVPESSVVEMRINSAETDTEILINGTVESPDLDSGPVSYPQVRIQKVVDSSTSETSYQMIFADISIGVLLKHKLLKISLVVGSSFSGATLGLMGNFNGNRDDDFRLPSGTLFASGESQLESELYNYGLNWRVSESESLFTYDGSLTYANVNNDTVYSPVYFNANLNVMFTDATVRSEAQGACYNGSEATDPNPSLNRECYFDYYITQNAAIAMDTSASIQQVEALKQDLENMPPVFQDTSHVLEVEGGQSYSSLYTVTATDPNGDSVTFNVSSSTTDGLTIGATSGVVAWTNVPSDGPITAEITASDGTAVAVWLPRIELCKCQNGGTCDFSVTGIELFVVVPCTCTVAYEGDFCETDIDGCASNPCYTGIRCRDVPASQHDASSAGFECLDPCPVGLVGNGIQCTDRDECAEDSPCDQTCDNLIGSFTCSCEPGYVLGDDLRTCSDIDECALGQDLCDTPRATCTNTVGSYTCSCIDGYNDRGAGFIGDCENINECDTVTCQANAGCFDTEGSYQCLCLAGYTFNADTNSCDEIDECSFPTVICEQICVDEIALYTCDCNAGFDLDADQFSCTPNATCNSTQLASCDNGNSRSTCAISTSGDVLCQCPPGFALDASTVCQDIDECSTGTALCNQEISTCENRAGDYICNCNSGYQSDGTNNVDCTDVDECASSSTNDCVSPAQCINNVGSYVCSCSSGYELTADGLGCTNLDECSQSTLNNCDKEEGTCTDTTPGYTCGCISGYTLAADDLNCIDEDECQQVGNGGCDQNCRNTIGSRDCYCNAGYNLDGDGVTCNDIDECSSDITNDCYDSFHCSNVAGSFTCSCPSGFSLKADGRTCESDTACADNHGCSYICNVVSSNDVCFCPDGQQLGSDNQTCEGIDECADSSLNLCEIANNVLCQDTDVGYSCVCVNSSYEPAEPTRCADVDECIAGTHTCPQHSVCENLEPGFNCSCQAGYIAIGGVCQDKDECALGEDNCNSTLATCTNTPGGYTCSCNSGYQGNGIVCTDYDECAFETDNCDHRVGRGICNNTVGSFICMCASGYTLASDGVTCNDLDECTTGTHTCEEICTNKDGGYLCSCQTGFRLDTDQRGCIAEKNCTSSSSSACQYECVNIDGTDTCVCPTGYHLNADGATCSDTDECATMSPCDSERGVCSNEVGSFSCSCSGGFILGPSNVCRDRNGGWSDWSDWSTCTLTCSGGTQTRTRTCSNPSREGNGADCEGIDSEDQGCNNVLCPASEDEGMYGVRISFGRLTEPQFTSISDSFRQSVADEANTYCNKNATTVKDCCNTSTSFSPNPSSPLEFTNTGNVVISDDYPVVIDGDVVVLILIKFDDNNPLCTAARAASSLRRKKRAITLGSSELALDQLVLLKILTESQTAIIQDIVNAIEAVTGLTLAVTIDNLSLVTASGGTTQNPSDASDKTPTWVIIVATMGALILLGIIILVVFLIYKMHTQNKVHSVDNVNEAAGDSGRSRTTRATGATEEAHASRATESARATGATRPSEHSQPPQTQRGKPQFSQRTTSSSGMVPVDSNPPEDEYPSQLLRPPSAGSGSQFIQVAPLSDGDT